MNGVDKRFKENSIIKTFIAYIYACFQATIYFKLLHIDSSKTSRQSSASDSFFLSSFKNPAFLNSRRFTSLLESLLKIRIKKLFGYFVYQKIVQWLNKGSCHFKSAHFLYYTYYSLIHRKMPVAFGSRSTLDILKSRY